MKVRKNERRIVNTEAHKGKYQFEDLGKETIGAAIQVHKKLGPGFLESIHKEALRDVKRVVN